MVSRQGELHSHVLAIFSSHALQLLWIFDVHRLRIKDFKEFLCFRPRIFALSNGVHNLPNLHHLHLHLLHISRSCCSLRHLAVFASLSLCSCSCPISAPVQPQDCGAGSTNRLAAAVSYRCSKVLAFLRLLRLRGILGQDTLLLLGIYSANGYLLQKKDETGNTRKTIYFFGT